tara:strand:- start:4012 stop:6375 length:2364 start_codon:yes stop_codon:yes gene_type:complete
MIFKKINTSALKINNFQTFLFLVLILVTISPFLLNQLTNSSINKYEIDPISSEVVIFENSCLSREVANNLYSEYLKELESNEINKDIYVIPEFENLKCIGKIVDIKLYEDNLDFYIGTNPKVTNLIYYGSLALFLFGSIISKKKVNLIVNIFLYTIFTISYLIFYLPRDEILYFFSIGYFFYSLLINYLVSKKRLDVMNIAVTVLFPTFVLVQFGIEWLFERSYLYIGYLIFYFLYKKKKEKIHKNFFLINSIILSFILNFGSFLIPLRDAEHWRQNQNAFAAKIMSQDNLSIFNPLPVFGVNSIVPMEVPFMQIFSGAIQKIGINEIFTLRPVAWGIYLILLTLIYKLGKNLSDNLFSEIITIFLVFHPMMFKFSNSYLGEFIPHIFGIASIIFLLKENRYSSILLSLALLSKVTTGSIYFLLWIYYLIKYKKYDKKEFILAISIISIPNILWNFLADSIKSSNPLSTWLNSTNLRYWNFGTFEQYTDINTYRKIISFMVDNFWGLNFAYVGLILIIISLIFKKELLSILLIPFIFINLYYSHEYYFLAIVPIGLFYLLLLLKEKINTDWVFIATTLVLLLNINLGMNDTKASNLRIAFKINEEVDKEESLSKKLNEYSFENTYLSSNVDDWNSIIFYESNKRGFMYQERFEELGNSNWNPIEISYQNINLFVFLENNLKLDHLDIFLEHNFASYNNLKLDVFEFVPSYGGYKNRKLFYIIISPYQNSERFDFLISREKLINNEEALNCIQNSNLLNQTIKDDLNKILEENTVYSFKLSEDTSICK